MVHDFFEYKMVIVHETIFELRFSSPYPMIHENWNIYSINASYTDRSRRTLAVYYEKLIYFLNIQTALKLCGHVGNNTVSYDHDWYERGAERGTEWATHKSSCKPTSMYLSLKRVMRINPSYHSLPALIPSFVSFIYIHCTLEFTTGFQSWLFLISCPTNLLLRGTNHFSISITRVASG